MAEIDDWTTPPVDDWATVKRVPIGAESADHGLSERQKLSPVGKALSPITSLPETYGHMNKEARDQMSRGWSQITNPDSLIDPKAHGISDVVSGAANMGLGGLNFIASPINAAYRSLIGQPVEDVTGIPREHTEFAAQLATPGLGFTRLPKAPGAVAETMPKIRQIEGPDLTSPKAAANRELADEFGIPLTRGQATEDAGAIRFEDMAARGAHGDEMQGIAKPAFEDQYSAIQSAGQRVGQTLSRGEQPLDAPHSAATALNTQIGDAAAAARGTRDEAVALAEREAAARRAGVAQTEENIGARIAGENPRVENPRQAGEVVNDAVRDAAAEDRAYYQAKYEDVARRPGEFQEGAFQGVGSRIRNDLHFHPDSPVEITELTPSARNAIAALDEWSQPNILNAADPRAPFADAQRIVSLKNVDTFAKRLSSYYRQAATPEDRRAVGRIMGEFGNQVERIVADGLFSGDPSALAALREAKDAFARYQRTYRPGEAGDAVGTAMRRIVERNATAEDTANMIVGSGKIGNAGLPVQIAGGLEQILGGGSEAWAAVRQAIWQKASQVRSGAAGEIDAARSARSILDFVDSSLARRVFSQEERAAMRAHAQGTRDLENVIATLPSTQRAENARAVYQRAFGGEGLSGSQRQVFQRMVEGTAQPEEISRAMFGIIGGGNPADASLAIAAVERIVGADSPIVGTIRHGVWQKLTQNPFGKDQQGQQKLVQGINEFLNGKGRDVAEQLYTKEERALMARYGEAVRRTIIGRYSRTNSDTAVATGALAQRQAHAIAGTIASLFHLGPIGHLGGNFVAKKIGEKVGRLNAADDARALRDSVSDNIPAQPWTSGKPPPVPSALRPPIAPVVDERKERAAGGRLAARGRYLAAQRA